MKNPGSTAPPAHRLQRLLKRAARRLLGRPQPPAVISQHPFDRLHGVETSGLLEAAELHTGHPNDAFSTAYFGVPPSRFENALERWRATPDTAPAELYRFVDVGCGKGRALLLASRMNFRDAVGIELHPELAGIAVANLQRWRTLHSDVGETSVLCADAVSALPDLLDGPVLIYLYNPFRAPVLRSLLESLCTAQASLSGPVDILYLYPEHEAVFEAFPQIHKLWHQQIGISREDEDDGLSSPTDPCSLYRLLPSGERPAH